MGFEGVYFSFLIKFPEIRIQIFEKKKDLREILSILIVTFVLKFGFLFVRFGSCQ